MAKRKQPVATSVQSQDEAVRAAIDTLANEGREITTAAILWLLHSKGMTDVRAEEIWKSPAWKELLAKEKGSPRAAPKPREANMVKVKQAEATQPVQTNEKKISKMEMVRQTIATLGKEAMPLAIQSFVKEQFDAEMSAAMASTYKRTVLMEKGKKRGRPKGPRKAATAVAPAAAPITQAASGSGNGSAISVTDIQAVKELVDRMGAEKVQQLAEVLAT